MRGLILSVAVAGIMTSAVSLRPVEAVEPATTALDWQPDLHSAHAISLRENKPMLLVFGAEWCGWCKKLEKSTLGDPKMARYINETFVPIHIDVDEQKKVAEILEVEALPCTIVLSPQADLLGRFEGFDKPAGMYKKLAAAKKLQDSVSPAAGTSSP